MIVTSVLLILVAVTLLVLGLVSGASELLVASIAASLLAAIALVIGARQAAAARTGDGYRDRARGGQGAGEARPGRVPAREPVAAGAPGRPHGRTATADAVTESFPAAAPPQGVPPHGIPPQDVPDPDLGAPRAPVGPPAGLAPPQVETAAQPPVDAGAPDGEIDDEDDPPDEPAPQQVSPADAGRVARMSTPVLVVDGRPRYHLSGCVHLLGRDSEPLPVAEAVELGFTPCSLCEPDTALLAEAR